MVIKKIAYEKEFSTEINYEDVARHGSPNLVPYWGANKKAEELAESITKEFELNRLNHSAFGSLGFDGRFQYTFEFRGNGLHRKFEGKYEKGFSGKIIEEGEVPRYKLICEITKAGKKEELPIVLSDLESRLKEEGFVVAQK